MSKVTLKPKVTCFDSYFCEVNVTMRKCEAHCFKYQKSNFLVYASVVFRVWLGDILAGIIAKGMFASLILKQRHRKRLFGSHEEL